MRTRLCIPHVLGATLLLAVAVGCSDSPALTGPESDLHRGRGQSPRVVGVVAGSFSFDFPSPPFPPGVGSDQALFATLLSDGSARGYIKGRRDPAPPIFPEEGRALFRVTCVHISEDAREATLQSELVHNNDGVLPLGTLFQTQIVLDEDGELDQVVHAVAPDDVTGSNCDEIDLSFLLQPATAGKVKIKRL